MLEKNDENMQIISYFPGKVKIFELIRFIFQSKKEIN